MQVILQKLLRRPLCLAVVFYVIAGFFVQIFISPPREEAAEFAEGAHVSLTGQLYKKETKNNRQIYYLKEIQIKQNSDQKSDQNSNKEKETEYTYEPADGAKVICYMTDASAEDVPVGRWLWVEGEVLPFEAAENDGQFDAHAYYAGLGISLRLWDTVVLAQGKAYDAAAEKMVNIKQSIASKFRAYMSEENAGVLSAMLLGDKTSMDSEIKNLYRKNGIAHILAISGLHISLLGMCMYRFLRRLYLPPKLCSVFGMVFVLVYIKFAGVSTSSFRAVCMFVLYMLADLLGRTYDLLTALAFSALLLLIDTPEAMFEAGFLLSYLAVLGLAVVLPMLQACLPGEVSAGWPGRFANRLLPGLSVQILILPIILWFYYEFPMYSFLLNLIVVPCMSVVLISGIIGALPWGGAVLYLPDALLRFYEWLCRLAEGLPGAVIVTGRPELWQIVLYYAAVAAWLIWGILGREAGTKNSGGKRRRRRTWPGQVAFALFPFLCMVLFLFPVHREDRLDMLSVGQGDCLVMRDSSGRAVIVDGGSTDVSEAGKYRLLPFLKYHGISEVDAVFLSHAHEDHYSAVAELLESAGEDGVRIKTLCLSGYAAGTQAYEQLVLLAGQAGCDVVYLNPGERVSCGKMEFVCVYPPAEFSATDENDTSMVLLATLSGFSVLFTGDSTTACDVQVIRRLQEAGVSGIDCLKVAHHGAKTSTSEALLDAFSFDLALISCGAGNSYGHPHAELSERLKNAGCETFVTAEDGQVTLRIGNGKVRVERYGKK